MAGRADKKERSRRHFDRWARSYERDRFSRRLMAVQDSALAALGLGPEDRLLDVGCGTGAAVRRAAPTIGRAVGVDLSPAMIARARELAAGIENVEFEEGDSERLPFPDLDFTRVLCTTSFHHYPNPQQAVREMGRVLAPGGRLVIGDACSDRLASRVVDRLLRLVQRSHVRFYRSADLRGMLDQAGLLHEGTQLLWGGAYMIVRARKAPA